MLLWLCHSPHSIEGKGACAKDESSQNIPRTIFVLKGTIIMEDTKACQNTGGKQVCDYLARGLCVLNTGRNTSRLRLRDLKIKA